MTVSKNLGLQYLFAFKNKFPRRIIPGIDSSTNKHHVYIMYSKILFITEAWHVHTTTNFFQIL